jgi:RIO kinase 1
VFLLCRYVSGDFRFRSGYCRSNPRKMVKTWAEKEMRNLARLRAAGIPAPAPLLLRMHVLVMDFVGDDGVAAPRLKVRACSAGQQPSSLVQPQLQQV